MLKISRQQTLNRWDILPQNLREALFSEYNANILWKICEEQHLSEDKIRAVATLTGDVILGFMHPEDLDDEIKKELGINSEIAASIARQIDRKIFAPIKNDIDKVYAPPGVLAEEKLAEESELPTEISEEHIVDLRKAEAPKIIGEEKKAAEVPISPAPEIKKEQSITQLPITQLPPEGPIIIHKEAEIKTTETKRSFGGLFGILKKEEIKEEIKPAPIKAEIQIGQVAPEEKPRVVHYTVESVIPEIELTPPKPAKKGVFRALIDFLKSLFVKKEVQYKEISEDKEAEPSETLSRFETVSLPKVEKKVEMSRSDIPEGLILKTEIPKPETMGGSEAEALLPPESDWIKELKKKQEEKETPPPSTPPPSSPPPPPKFEIKKGEEMVDLNTLQMTNNQQPTINDK